MGWPVTALRLIMMCVGILGIGQMLPAEADTVTVGTGCTLDNALAFLNLATGSKGSCTSVSSATSGSSGSSSSGSSTVATTNTVNLPAGLIQLTHTEVINGNLSMGGTGQLANADGSLGTTETRIVAPPGQRAFVFVSSTTPISLTLSTANSAALVLNQIELSGLSITGGTATGDCNSEVDTGTATTDKNGGVICSAANLKLTNVDIRGGQAQNNGGGVYIAPGGQLSLDTVAMMGNSVLAANGNGAALLTNNALLSITSASFYDQCNTKAPLPATAPAACPAGAADYTVANIGLPGPNAATVFQQSWQNLTVSANLAGGIYDEGKLVINNATIAGNLAGLSLPPVSMVSSFTQIGWLLALTNSILAGNNQDCINFQGGLLQSSASEILNFVGNLVTTTGGCPFAAVDPGVTVPSPLIGFDHIDSNYNVVLNTTAKDQTLIAQSGFQPTDIGILAPIGNYGGNIWTMKSRFLLDYTTRDQSPVIGRGGPTITSNGSNSVFTCASNDARAHSRSSCDIGADQYQFPLSSGTLALTGVMGQPVSATNLNTLLGDSDMLPLASSLTPSEQQWACNSSALFGSTPLTQQAQSTLPGCSWVVPDALSGGSGGIPSTETRGNVSFNASTGTLVYTPDYVFHGVATFNLRLTTTSSIFNSDYNQRFVTDVVTVTDEPAEGASSQTLGVFTAGSMDVWDMLMLLGLGVGLLMAGTARKGNRCLDACGLLKQASPVVLPVLLLLLGFVPSLAQATIYSAVNTFEDQIGEDPLHCSLREAIISNALNENFGGCTYGDTITLPNGTYILTHGELDVQGSVTIQGYDITTDPNKANASTVDPFTDIVPLRAPPTTIITTIPAGGNTPQSRIAYVQNGGSLFLQNVVLNGGVAKAELTPDGAIPADGGLIFSHGSVALTNVEAFGGAAATGNGGAFAMYGGSASLSLTGSYIHNNQAGGCGGAVFFGPMVFTTGTACNPAKIDPVNSCSYNGVYNKLSFSASQSTLYQNTAQVAASGIAFCGNATINITNSTFEQQGSGAALSFMAISPGSVATLQNDTITDNQTGIEFLQPVISNFTISNTIIFWNKTDCDYSIYGAGNAPPVAPVGSRYNLFGSSCASNGNAAKNQGAWLDNQGTNNFSLVNVNPANTLEDPLGAIHSGQLIWVTSTQNPVDTLPFPMMLPTATANMIIGQGASGTGGCAGTDERGVSRSVPAPSGCDIGAGQRKRLIAQNDTGGNNVSKAGVGLGRQVLVDILSNDEAPEEKNLLDLQSWGVANVTGGCTWDPVVHLLHFDGSSLGDFGTGSKAVACSYQLCGNTSCSVLSAPARVDITISNEAPLANDDTLYFLGNEPATINVLANDYDQDGGAPGTTTFNSFNRLDTTSVTIVGFPVTGSITCNPANAATFLLSSTGKTQCPGGVVTYTAFDNYAKFQDQFTYTVNDIDGSKSNTATVNVLPKDQHLPWQTGGSVDFWELLIVPMLALRQRWNNRIEKEKSGND